MAPMVFSFPAPSCRALSRRRVRPRSHAPRKSLGNPGPLSHAGLSRAHDRLRARLNTQLVEDARDVVAHRLLRHPELRGDLSIVQAARQALHDLGFARGEAGNRCRATCRQESLQLLEEALPRRLVREQDMVGGIERHEARTRYDTGELPSQLERNPPILARM